MTVFDLVLPAALVLGGYLLICLGWPYKNCRTCHGQGKLRAFMGVRYCPPCDGTGLRLRAGRRFLDSIRRHR
ncbi:hypothetical protein [Saccharopolyspora sp. NPDC002686]|uniref:hypothetical protein n=1 Tax=Saccharopolyspora sp. NPDC002686 TaxID=3154541 RepID=UPI0033167171